MEFGIVMSSQLGDDWRAGKHLGQGSTWQSRHYTALVAPTAVEKPLADLLGALVELIKRYGDDHVLNGGIAHIIQGTQRILDGEWGNIDRGSVSTALHAMATEIGFNLELDRWENK